MHQETHAFILVGLSLLGEKVLLGGAEMRGGCRLVAGGVASARFEVGHWGVFTGSIHLLREGGPLFGVISGELVGCNELDVGFIFSNSVGWTGAGGSE